MTAARNTALVELVSTALVLAGMLPVLVSLTEWWGFTENLLASRFFWLDFSLAAIAGTLVVYPFNVWMARRDSVPSHTRATVGSESAELPPVPISIPILDHLPETK